MVSRFAFKINNVHDWCHVYELGSSETFVRLLLRYIVRCQITFICRTNVSFSFYFYRRFLPHISVRTYSKYILYTPVKYIFLFDRTLEAVLTLIPL